jgi:hypothetical protein
MRLERQVPVCHVIGSSAYRRRTALVTTQVLLCRMFLISCGAFVLFAMVVVPRVMTGFATESKSEVSTLMVRKLAFEAFPQWASVHHMDSCPASLDDLAIYTNDISTLDAWGKPLEMKCGPWIRGIYVRSAGEDGQFDTPDDITSNDG